VLHQPSVLPLLIISAGDFALRRFCCIIKTTDVFAHDLLACIGNESQGAQNRVPTL
jgi:hypothetical protein